ncbi:DNA-3-methyladenine glycosylase family protein [Microbacterium sp. P05]|uniref:DNA-3-methyladenine glycosylase family protein n=1 Tax=Microbacterium sp. P05 TaxID=3366948 RepID=UPI00374714EE
MAALIAHRPHYDPHAALSELPPMKPFGVLLFQIIGQQISVPATRAILHRVISLFDGELPSPDRLLAKPLEALTAVGVSTRKALTMRAAAQVLIEKGLEDSLKVLSDAEIEAILTAIPGIGTWTVQGFLVIGLDRPDAFPAADLAIRRAVRDLSKTDSLPSEASVLERAEVWRPYRALAAGYLISADAERVAARRRK